MYKKLFRSCPLCDNKTGEILHKQLFKLPSNSPLPNEYDIVSCSKCGFVFADSSVNQKKYTEYYLSFSKYEDLNSVAASGGGTSEFDKNRLFETSINISDIIKDRSKLILDIGCANGGLLLMLKDQGFTCLNGLDPSAMCVRNVRDSGLNCEQGDLFDMEQIYKDQKFDVIILSHVLEHIYDLRKALLLLINHIEVDGTIYIEVPDASKYADYYLVPYHYFDVEHINHFDKYYLTVLFNSIGFDVVQSLEKEIPVSSSNVYPAIGVFFMKVNTLKFSVEEKNNKLATNINKYINLSKSKDYYPDINELALKQVPVVVWGAGSYTSRLMESSVLKECNITAFIDMDCKKHGNQINGVTINSPDILKNLDSPIIICSALYSDNIYQEIMVMGISNPIYIMK